MGAKATFNSVNRTITLTEAPSIIDGELVVGINAKVDLYGDQKEDWLANPNTLRKVRPPFSIIGGQTTPTGFAGNTIFIRSDWKIIPYSGDHILRVEGNLYSSDGKSPFIKPSSGFVQIERVVSNIVDTVAIGSGVTAQDKVDIIQGMWNESETGKTGGLRTIFDNADAIDTKIDAQNVFMNMIKMVTMNRVTRVGDVITCYHDDGITIWRQYNVSDGGRVLIP